MTFESTLGTAKGLRPLANNKRYLTDDTLCSYCTRTYDAHHADRNPQSIERDGRKDI